MIIKYNVEKYSLANEARQGGKLFSDRFTAFSKRQRGRITSCCNKALGIQVKRRRKNAKVLGRKKRRKHE